MYYFCDTPIFIDTKKISKMKNLSSFLTLSKENTVNFVMTAFFTAPLSTLLWVSNCLLTLIIMRDSLFSWQTILIFLVILVIQLILIIVFSVILSLIKLIKTKQYNPGNNLI